MEYTKSKMLLHLRDNLPSVNVLPILVVQSGAFFQDPAGTIGEILGFAKGRPVIVRSSSTQEDTLGHSNAGKFESVLDVPPESAAIDGAVRKVCQSYGTAGDEEVLVQPMLQGIKKSGVVFTADMDTHADYYTVNYYEGSDSAAVTGGRQGSLRTFVKYKFGNGPVGDPDLGRLLGACREIEGFLGNSALDIEFAVTEGGEVYILQVRPIAGGQRQERVDLGIPLRKIYKKVRKLSARHPFLLGDTTCFGVMPDWNPAEILGARPRKLSISLYKELVTDHVWACQRHDYGYRDLTMSPLMISFCGVPYIDTRITFNSFVPQGLSDAIAEKLVNYYLGKLAEYPKYHDKVEFEIVFSCYCLGLPEKLKGLLDFGFNEKEITRIEFALLELTNRIISPKDGLYKKDLGKAAVLEENYNKIIQSDISTVDKIYWLLEECKAYGTLPFAGAARAGFIAVQFLRSFVDIGIIDRGMYDRYLNSLDTINKRMNHDLGRYYQGELSREEFLETYGHIRPGTYDILSKRYDEAFGEYFGGSPCLDMGDQDAGFELPRQAMDRIQLELEQNGLLITAGELMVFIREAIEGREYLKFVFTKSVSKILQLVGELGDRVGIPREDMAHLDISVVRQLYVDLYTGDIRDIFEGSIRSNKLQYRGAVQMKLPSIIVQPEDVYAFYLLGEEPNFVTQKSVTADTMDLDAGDADCGVGGKVVFVRAADPGYDFLFSKGIAGLVTQFGGANSHMAIRCAELGIPAVIGVGEKNYAEWSRYRRVTIDCLKKQVIKIK